MGTDNLMLSGLPSTIAGAFLDILGPGGTVPFGAPLMGWEASEASQSSWGVRGHCNPPPPPGKFLEYEQL